MATKNKIKHSPFKYFSRNGISVKALIVFIILTIGMIFTSSQFNIKGYILDTQFTDPNITSDWFLNNIEDCAHRFFKAYFYIDFIWPLSLLYIFGCYIFTKAQNNTKTKWFFWVFVVIAIAAYIFDVLENIHYLSQKTYPECIAVTKTLLYASNSIILILVFLRYSLQNRLKIIWDFISSSYISLIILFIIGSALPKIPQVNSIVVRLYYEPWQFVLLLLGFFAPIFCVVLSHYPNYFLLKKNKRITQKEWRISKRIWLFGTIWYLKSPKSDGSSKNYENYINFLRRTLGIFFYVALFYMIAFTASTNFDNKAFSGITAPLLLLLLWWLYVLKKKKERWQSKNKAYLENQIQDHTSDQFFMKTSISSKRTNHHKSLYNIQAPILTYAIFLCLTVILHIVFLAVLINYQRQETCPYNLTTVILSLTCIVLQAITYLYYRTYRSVFRYVFFNSKIKSILYAFTIMNRDTGDSHEGKKEALKKFFKEHDFTRNNILLKILSKIQIGSLSLGSMSNNVFFLQTIIWSGFVNGLFLLLLNWSSETALQFNAIIIILSYFFLFYGIIVIIIKHFIFYSSDDHFAKRYRKSFYFTFSISVLLLVVLNISARFAEPHLKNSNLFVLEKIERKKADELTLKEYTITFEKKSNKNVPRYYVGCYGGGMKANAWTMTVLNEIIKKHPDFVKNTVCLSGASGGTMGLINTFTALANEENAEKRDTIIAKIATENILSMDLTHLFGRDLFNHLYVSKSLYDLSGKDRSTAAMKVYAKHSKFDKTLFNNVPYRAYWKEHMYSKQNSTFPILIANTTNIKGGQGMAVSVRVDKKEIDSLLYMGAHNILELDEEAQKTLSYYNAVSTTNRFPLISPAATIEGKGQYNDGGIYENSGLLSAYKLYTAIEQLKKSTNKSSDSLCSKPNQKSVFINIVNDKDLFIRAYLSDALSECHWKDINESNEISAILNSVAATEMFPSYIKHKLEYLANVDPRTKDSIDFKSIYLPHKFSFEDIKRLYGTNIDTTCIDSIHKIIEHNSEAIDKALEESACHGVIIEPALSRVNAKPAHDFMEAMLKHHTVKNILTELRSGK